jgi:hypothetical protein
MSVQGPSSMPPDHRDHCSETAVPDGTTERQLALSRWDNEGGAGATGPTEPLRDPRPRGLLSPDALIPWHCVPELAYDDAANSKR